MLGERSLGIYVTSDLHGYPLNKLQNKLGEIGFGLDDHLYILVTASIAGVKVYNFSDG